MDPTQRLAYVSGVRRLRAHGRAAPRAARPRGRRDPRLPLRASGRAAETGTIPVPPPAARRPRRPSRPPTRAQEGGLARPPRGLARRSHAARPAQPRPTPRRSSTSPRKQRPLRARPAHYPYGAAILRDGRTGLVSNEAPGTVSVIDLQTGDEDQGHPGRRPSLPPGGDRARPARRPRLRRDRELRPGRGDRHQAARRSSARCRSGGRRASAPRRSRSAVTPDGAGCSSPSPAATSSRSSASRGAARRDAERRAPPCSPTRPARRGPSAEGRRPGRGGPRRGAPRPALGGRRTRRADSAASPGGRLPPRTSQVRAPAANAARSGQAQAAPPRAALREALWISGQGPRRRPNPHGPNPERQSTTTTRSRSSYLPAARHGPGGHPRPTRATARIRALTPAASRADPPVQRAAAPARHAAARGRPDQARLLHRAREPHLRPGARRRPARRRRPEAHDLRPAGDAEPPRARRALRRCSTTSTPTPRRRSTGTSGPAPAKVSDYVHKNWYQNYARPQASLRLRRVRRDLARQRLPLRPGRAPGHLVLQLRRGRGRRRPALPRQGPHHRGPRAGREAKFAKSDLGDPFGCYPERRLHRQERDLRQPGLGHDAARRAPAEHRVALRLLQGEVRRSRSRRHGSRLHLHHAAPATTPRARRRARRTPRAWWPTTTTRSAQIVDLDLALARSGRTRRSS